MEKLHLPAEFLAKELNPDPQDFQTPRQDLQLALTLNPSLDLIENAMVAYAKAHIENVLKSGKTAEEYILENF